MAVWDDPEELARRIAGAQAYFGEGQEQFAKRLGRSGRTLRKILDAELPSMGRTPEARRVLVDTLVANGCPAEWFGLSASDEGSETARRLDLLDEAVQRLAQRSLDEDELGDFEQWWSTDPRSGEQGPGGAND